MKVGNLKRDGIKMSLGKQNGSPHGLKSWLKLKVVVDGLKKRKKKGREILKRKNLETEEVGNHEIHPVVSK